MFHPPTAQGHGGFSPRLTIRPILAWTTWCWTPAVRPDGILMMGLFLKRSNQVRSRFITRPIVHLRPTLLGKVTTLLRTRSTTFVPAVAGNLLLYRFAPTGHLRWRTSPRPVSAIEGERLAGGMSARQLSTRHRQASGRGAY